MRIRVEDPSIDWLALRPQSDHKKVQVIESGTPRRIGTSSEEITIARADGRPALRRTQLLASDELGDREATTVVFWDGFRPYSHLDVTEAYTLSVAYRGTRVVGEKRIADREIRPIEAEVSSPVFDAHSVEMILRVLPFAEGYVAEIPVFHAGRAAQLLVNVQVTGRERLAMSGDSVNAWKVKTVWDGATQLYWIGVESRQLLRQFSELSEGVYLEIVRR